MLCENEDRKEKRDGAGHLDKITSTFSFVIRKALYQRPKTWFSAASSYVLVSILSLTLIEVWQARPESETASSRPEW